MESLTTYSLAAAGAIGGFYKYGIKPELTAGRAWAVIGVSVLAYEALCPQGELLSEGVDKALESHRLATTALIGAVSLHLLNVIPARFDPFQHGARLLGKFK